MAKKLVDGAGKLAEFTGLPRTSITDAWERIKANQKILNKCKVHAFGEVESLNSVTGYECHNCGGTMKGNAVYAYTRGYVAGDGNADDIYTLLEKKEEE